jgi:hypothetical protein
MKLQELLLESDKWTIPADQLAELYADHFFTFLYEGEGEDWKPVMLTNVPANVPAEKLLQIAKVLDSENAALIVEHLRNDDRTDEEHIQAIIDHHWYGAAKNKGNVIVEAMTISEWWTHFNEEWYGSSGDFE